MYNCHFRFCDVLLFFLCFILLTMRYNVFRLFADCLLFHLLCVLYHPFCCLFVFINCLPTIIWEINCSPALFPTPFILEYNIHSVSLSPLFLSLSSSIGGKVCYIKRHGQSKGAAPVMKEVLNRDEGFEEEDSDQWWSCISTHTWSV